MKIYQVLTNTKSIQCGVKEYTLMIFGDCENCSTILQRNLYNDFPTGIYNIQYHPHSISPDELIKFISNLRYDKRNIIVVTIHDDENFRSYANIMNMAHGLIVPSNNLKESCQPFVNIDIKVIAQPCVVIEKELLFNGYNKNLLVYHGFPGSEKRFIETIEYIIKKYGHDKYEHLVLSCADNPKRMEYIKKLRRSFSYDEVKIIPNFITRYEIIKNMSRALCTIYFYNEQPSVRSSSAIINTISARIPVIISNCNSLSWLKNTFNAGLIAHDMSYISMYLDNLRDDDYRNKCVREIELAYEEMRADKVLKYHEEYYAEIASRK